MTALKQNSRTERQRLDEASATQQQVEVLLFPCSPVHISGLRCLRDRLVCTAGREHWNYIKNDTILKILKRFIICALST